MTSEPNSTWLQLTDWLDGRVSPAEAEDIEARMGNASDSRRDDMAADVAWLRAFKRVANEVLLDEPPQELRLALRASFAEYASKQAEGDEGLVRLVGRVIAALSFDSGPQLGLAGARATAASTPRQLIYSTDAADISLNIHAQADGLQIDGQILPNSEMHLESFLVSLSKGENGIDEVKVDELGQFSLSGIKQDIYQLTLTSDSLTILIESTDLRA